MRNFAPKAWRVLDIANEAAGFLMLLTTIVVVFLAVLGRYVFAIPLPWTEEVARFAFIWLAFIGLSVAERHNAHFRISYFVDRLPDRPKSWIFVFNELVVFSVLATLLVEGIRFSAMGMQGLSSVMELPLHYIYMALPIAVCLTIVNRSRRIAYLYFNSRAAAGADEATFSDTVT